MNAQIPKPYPNRLQVLNKRFQLISAVPLYGFADFGISIQRERYVCSDTRIGVGNFSG